MWDGVAIEVRIGLHTGLAQQRDGGFYGSEVNRAARIQSLAGSGQVLLSKATERSVRSRLPAHLSTVDLGEHALKSLSRPEHLFQLIGPGLSDRLARPSRGASDSIPKAPTRFVGRDTELDDLMGLVQPGRVVTITGLGGSGKTRMAIEAAQRLAGSFRDGVCWIDLAPLRDPAAIAPLLASTLGLAQQARMTTTESVVDGIAQQEMLIVLDNAEHLIDDVGRFVDALLDGVEHLAVLTTSQEPLRLGAERIWALGGLPPSSGAVELLLERARHHDASATVDDWDADALAELCRRLDGMPLAIEMAAARLRVMSPSEIVERLDDRFRLLRTTQRNVPDRHQSLLATLDWSYDLLTPDERRLLDRLSIFSGSFPPESIAQVCLDAGPGSIDGIDDTEVLDLVESLLDKSLITVDRSKTRTRYRLLESVRHYGAAHLTDDERTVLADRHLAYVVSRTTRAATQWYGSSAREFETARDTFEQEWDDIRSAVARATERAEIEALDAILRSIWTYAWETFHVEVGDWARTAMRLDPPPPVASAMVAMATGGRGTEAAIELLQTALARLGDPIDPHPDATLVHGVLYGLLLASDEAAALEHALAARHHAAAFGDNEVAYQSANVAALLASSDPDQAERFLADARRLIASSSNPTRVVCFPTVASAEASLGRPDIGHRLCREAVEVAATAGLRWTESMLVCEQASIALRFGVGDVISDLAAALSSARRNRAWYALWLTMGRAVPWLVERGWNDVADPIAGHMIANRIGFAIPIDQRARFEAGDDPDAAARHAIGADLRRDELVDRTVSRLEALAVPSS